MFKAYEGTLYGNYRTLTFTQFYPDKDKFLNDYHGLGLPVTISDTDATTLYYILYSRYANSHIASSDPNRFKYDLFAKIWQYAPNWVRKLDIQKKLREMTDEELLEGARQIYNSAQNPSVNPSTFSEEELQYINSQNVTKSRKGKLDGYAMLVSLLRDDITEDLLNKFRKLFLVIVEPECPLFYENEDKGDN